MWKNGFIKVIKIYWAISPRFPVPLYVSFRRRIADDNTDNYLSVFFQQQRSSVNCIRITLFIEIIISIPSQTIGHREDRRTRSLSWNFSSALLPIIIIIIYGRFW